MNNSDKLRLLLIGPLPPPIGGATVSFEQIVNEIKKRKDIEMKILKWWRRDKNFIIKSISVFIMLMKVFTLFRKFDVIVLFSCEKATKMFSPLINVISKLSDKPWILRTFGGSFDIIYKESSTFWKNIIKHCVLDADLCLFQTKYLVNFFRKINPKANIEWHANSRPVDDNEITSVKKNKCTRFVFIGQLMPEKGIKEMTIASRMVTEDIKIDIYGPLGGNANEALLENSVRTYYKGILKPSEVIKTLKNYDALILPTYFIVEGYPGVILEAYSAGIPVIATRWRSIPEIVDNSSGILIEPHSAEDLARAMLKLHDDRELYIRLCEGAAKKREEFSLNLWTEKFVNYCKKTIN